MTTPSDSHSSTPEDRLPKSGSETLDNKRVWKAIAGVGIKEAMADDAKEMVLICAGLGRTGTSSLKLAPPLASESEPNFRPRPHPPAQVAAGT